MLDLETELQNFKPINLDDFAQGDEIPDQLRNSIFLYNKAIDSLKSGSEDMAVIELKKATSMNPHFCEAMNLLGLCYSYLGDMEKAGEMFDKVMKVESNSILAVSYQKRFGLSETQPQKNKAARKQAEPKNDSLKKGGQQNDAPQNGTSPNNAPLKRVRESRTAPAPLIPVNRRTLSNILKIAGGFAAGLLIASIIFISLPGRRNEPAVPAQSTTDNSVATAKIEDSSQYKALKNKYDLLQKDKADAAQQADYYKAALKLYEIEDLVSSRQYENAADMLILLKTVAFKDGEKTKYDSLCQAVMPRAARIAYEQGYRYYNSRKYQDSLKELGKVQTYAPQFNRADAALYYMGRNCQALQDSRSASAYYQKLLTDYPNSSYARGAKSWLKQLTRNP